LLRWFRQLTARNGDDKRQEKLLASSETQLRESRHVSTAAPVPGEIIADYEILERIGGNMGLVFQARHRLLDRVVALKLLPAEWIADPVRLARFQREMRVMGQLEHPNLVTAADARSVGQWHLVAMELIDGLDLQQLIRTRGPLPIAAACEAARQAAQGLQHAHEHGLVHRDIKPSNLMLTRTGIIKVIDMGLALARGDSAAQVTQSGLVLGTMSYCAPEQFQGASQVDIRADIYSLGCTLYHLITGKSPYWQRKTWVEVMQAHLHEPFPKLTQARPDAPAALEAVLTRMTAKDPNDRFSTPREVIDALEPFARGAEMASLVPVRTQQSPSQRVNTSRTPATPERQPAATVPEQQSPRWPRMAAVVVLLLAIAGAVFLFMKHDPVVLLMDTTSPPGIYDLDNRTGGTGGSNTKEVRKALQDLGFMPPLTLHQEPIDLNWGGESRVRYLRPDLVIIHRSSFFHPINAILNLTNSVDHARWQAVYELAEDKLISFMGYVASHSPGTQFLVYSRGTDPQWTNDFWRTQWPKTLEARFPELKGRVTPMVIPHGYKGSFREPETRELLGSNVTAILKLPKKSK
jgi:serine/threonine protein kinase